MAGVVILALVALVEVVSLRRMLAVPIAITVSSLFFFVIGYPTLSLPICPPVPGPVACAGEGARDRTLWALGAFVVGAVLTLVLAVVPRRTEPS